MSKTKLRKGVSALIMNDKKEFLLVNLQSFENHYFAIPGGGIDSNESINNAVYREIYEELGITKQLLKYVGVCKQPLHFTFKTKKIYRDGIEYHGSERYFFGFKFIGDGSEIKLQENEIRSCVWVRYENLKDYLLFDNQLKDTNEKLVELFPFEK